ncbi:unnamed protein product [Larinioides sclopetarius]|uniref:Uncharacterized protein n=1 Tax=Larinioides sclopetarius TaxID=280406 RepID=A0AAV2BG32_9ARAC
MPLTPLSQANELLNRIDDFCSCGS